MINNWNIYRLNSGFYRRKFKQFYKSTKTLVINQICTRKCHSVDVVIYLIVKHPLKTAVRQSKTCEINRGYYTAARRYDFYLREVKTIFYERAQRVSKILFLTREDKSHIFKPPCNVLFII